MPPVTTSRKKADLGTQYWLLCGKNFRTSLRDLSILKIVLLPIMVVLVHYCMNGIFTSIADKGSLLSEVTPIVEKIPNYCAAPKNADINPLCYNTVYMPSNVPWVEDMMKDMANASGLSFDTFLGIEVEDVTIINANLIEKTVNACMTDFHMQGFVAFHVCDDETDEASCFIGDKAPLNPDYRAFYHANTSKLLWAQALGYRIEKYVFDRYFTDRGIDTSYINLAFKYTGYPMPPNEFVVSNLPSIICSILYNFISTFTFTLLLLDLVSEKHIHMRASLHYAGVSRFPYFLAWMTYCVAISCLSAFVLCVAGVILPLDMFRNSNILIIFILYAMLNLSMGCCAFLASTFVSSPDSSMIWVYIITVAGMFCQLYLTISNGFIITIIHGSTSVAMIIIRILSCIFPFGVAGHIYSVIAVLTSPNIINGPGPKIVRLSFSSFFETPVLPKNCPALSTLYSWLWIISAVVLVLYWYFDTVLFHIGSKQHPPYFFLQPSYWGIHVFRKKRAVVTLPSPCIDSSPPVDPSVSAEHQRAFDAMQSGQEEEIAINVVGVTKVYSSWQNCRSSPPFSAVDGLSLSVKRGEFFTIIGHNGAGKTTLFSMLSGRLPMTSGHASFFGMNLKDDVEEVHQLTGNCLQHDVFWPELTAMEHLVLFQRIRGRSGEETESHMKELLRLLDLEAVVNQRVDSFSGGMKRRLSFAIACTGDPEILFLDEPSSGLDPANYRRLWHVLQSMRGKVTIVLVTHNMVEAELLSDRVGVMADGQFRALGTGLHLKSAFGYGYRVDVCLADETSASFVARYRKAHACVEAKEGADPMRVQLDVRKEDLTQVPELLADLEGDRNVKAWGVCQSSLESVFMSIAEKYDLRKIFGKADAPKEKKADAVTVADDDAEVLLTRRKVTSYPFSALMKKNWVVQCCRNGCSTACVILLPILAFAILTLFQVYVKQAYVDDEELNDIFSMPNVTFGRYYQGYQNAMCWMPEEFTYYALFDPGLDPALTGVVGDSVDANQGIYSNAMTVSCPSRRNPFTAPGPPILKLDESSLRREIYDLLVDRLDAAAAYDAEPDLSLYPVGYFYARFHALSIDVTNATAPRADLDVTLAVNDLNQVPIRTDLNLVVPWRIDVNNLNVDKLNIFMKLQEFSVLYRAFRVTLAKSLGDTGASQTRSFIQFSMLPAEMDTQMLDKLIMQIGVMGLHPYAFSFIIPMALYMLAKEKGDRIKQMMYIHGLSPTYYYLSIVINWGLIYVVSVALFIAFGFASSSEFVTSAITTLIALFIGWGLALISFILLVFVCVEQSGVATFIGFGTASLLTIISNSVAVELYMPRDTLRYPMPKWLYAWFQVGFLRCLYLVTDRSEEALLGEIWTVSDTPEFIRSLVSIYLCAVLYFTLFVIILAFRTGDFSGPHHAYVVAKFKTWKAIKRPFNRFFPPSTPSPAIPYNSDDDAIQLGLADVAREKALVARLLPDAASDPSATDDDRGEIGSSDFLPGAPEELRRCPLVIQNMQKRYPSGKLAVKDFSLHAPLSGCFGLLGENGAGKSTLLSMITGTIPITSGTAYICGFDISRHLSRALKCIGFCPQSDVLWSELSVREHLEFYAKLGGIRPSSARRHVNKLLLDVGLYDCRHRQSIELSGGMRRRLSLSIALCANSYVVFLDEPSCGLDVMNKRQLWDIIERNKRGRAIILTTHGMDEADTLCDRIGIMVQGALWCYGDPQYIKTLYGQGSLLTVRFSSVRGGSAFIRDNIPSAKVVSLFEKTREYYIPPSEHLSHIFRIMLGSASSGISDWGLSQTGLEYVFERIINHVHGTALSDAV